MVSRGELSFTFADGSAEMQDVMRNQMPADFSGGAHDPDGGDGMAATGIGTAADVYIDISLVQRQIEVGEFIGYGLGQAAGEADSKSAGGGAGTGDDISIRAGANVR